MPSFIKIVTLIFVVFSYFIFAMFGMLVQFFNKTFAIKLILTPNIRFHSMLCFLILGIRINEYNKEVKDSLPKGALIIANHRSYLDMMIMHNITDGCFITSREVQRDPIFSLFAKTSGCIFVNRESRNDQADEKAQEASYLKKGINVLLFPESKATSGEMIRFRRPFFEPAKDLSTNILCTTINYVLIDGEKINSMNKENVFWYRQMPIDQHLKNLIKIKEIIINIQYNVLTPSEYNSSDLHVADYAQEIIKQNYVEILDEVR